ncbi:hypothetical protein EYE40_12035 [Glaciihabitans arcticus]|uniref:Secreted protein n=1 Tax=Glaciihabitans arcticus TaxID=2668039 RepID=A0A4Q9GV18_9MICO|nr:hypothetical protein [Glaciihabitans arcticus]TBN58064.1 hypothetical protein EYE40_12035 [Glaciihabitans arcticus]
MIVSSRTLVTALAAALLAASLAGCTAGSPEPKPTSSADAEQTPGITDIDDTPGSGEDLVGALADNTMGDCVRDGDAWKVSGTVANPTEEAASYRIYVSLLNGANDTRALVQVDVDDLAAGEEETWDTEIPVAEDDLSCVLRVERYVA